MKKYREDKNNEDPSDSDKLITMCKQVLRLYNEIFF